MDKSHSWNAVRLQDRIRAMNETLDHVDSGILVEKRSDDTTRPEEEEETIIPSKRSIVDIWRKREESVKSMSTAVVTTTGHKNKRSEEQEEKKENDIVSVTVKEDPHLVVSSVTKKWTQPVSARKTTLTRTPSPSRKNYDATDLTILPPSSGGSQHKQRTNKVAQIWEKINVDTNNIDEATSPIVEATPTPPASKRKSVVDIWKNRVHPTGNNSLPSTAASFPGMASPGRPASPPVDEESITSTSERSNQPQQPIHQRWQRTTTKSSSPTQFSPVVPTTVRKSPAMAVSNPKWIAEASSEPATRLTPSPPQKSVSPVPPTWKTQRASPTPIANITSPTPGHTKSSHTIIPGKSVGKKEDEEEKSPAMEHSHPVGQKLRQSAGTVRPMYSLPPPRLNRGNLSSPPPPPQPPPLTDIPETETDKSKETITTVEETLNSAIATNTTTSSSFSKITDRWNKATGSSHPTPPAPPPTSWRKTLSPITPLSHMLHATVIDHEPIVVEDAQKETPIPREEDASPQKSTANGTTTTSGKVTDRWRFSWTASDNTDTMSDVVSSFSKSKWNQNVAALVNSHVNRITAAHGQNSMPKRSSFSGESSKLSKTDTAQRMESVIQAATLDEDVISHRSSLHDEHSYHDEKFESAENRRKSTSSTSSLSPVVVPSDATSLIRDYASQTPVAKRRNKVLDRWFAAGNANPGQVEAAKSNLVKDSEENSDIVAERSQSHSSQMNQSIKIQKKIDNQWKNQNVNKIQSTNVASKNQILSKLVKEHSDHTPAGARRKAAGSHLSEENSAKGSVPLSGQAAASDNDNAVEDENDSRKNSDNLKQTLRSDLVPNQTSSSPTYHAISPPRHKSSPGRHARASLLPSNNDSSRSQLVQNASASGRQDVATSHHPITTSKADNKNEQDLFTLTSPLNIIQAWSDKKLSENSSEVMSDSGRSFLPTPKMKNTRSDIGTVSARSDAEFTSPFKIIDAWSKKPNPHPPAKKLAPIPKPPNESERPESRMSTATTVIENSSQDASAQSASSESVKCEPIDFTAPERCVGDGGKEDILRMKRKNFMMLGRKHIVSRMPQKLDGSKAMTESTSVAPNKTGNSLPHSSIDNDTKDDLLTRSAILPSPLKRWSKSTYNVAETKNLAGSNFRSSLSIDKDNSHKILKSLRTGHRNYRSMAIDKIDSEKKAVSVYQRVTSPAALNPGDNTASESHNGLDEALQDSKISSHTRAAYEMKRRASHHEHFRDIHEFQNRTSAMDKVANNSRTDHSRSNDESIPDDPTVGGSSFGDSTPSIQVEDEPELYVSPRHLRDDHRPPHHLLDTFVDPKAQQVSQRMPPKPVLNQELISAASEGVTSEGDASGLSILSDADSEMAGIHESSSKVSSSSFAERAERAIKERRRKQKDDTQQGHATHDIKNYSKKEMKVLDQFVKAATPSKDQDKIETDGDDLDDSLLAEDDIKPLLNTRYKTVSKLIDDIPINCQYPEKKRVKGDQNRTNDEGQTNSGVSAESAVTDGESKPSKTSSSQSKSSERRCQRRSKFSNDSDDFQQKNDPCGPREKCKPTAVKEIATDWVPSMSFNIHKLASAMDKKVNALRDFAGDFVGNGNSHCNTRQSLPIARSLKLPKCDGLSEVEDVAIEVEYVEDEEEVDYDSDDDNPEEDLGFCTRPLDGALRCTGVEKCDDLEAHYSQSTEESSSIMEMERVGGKRSSFPHR